MRGQLSDNAEVYSFGVVLQVSVRLFFSICYGSNFLWQNKTNDHVVQCRENVAVNST